jgi:hypothetical protein
MARWSKSRQQASWPRSTAIETTVPGDGTTGKVEVTMLSDTLTSNVNFRVKPTITSFLPTTRVLLTTDRCAK